MAQRNNNSNPLAAIGALIIGVPIVIFNFLQENVWVAFLIGGMVIAAIILIAVISSGRKKRFLNNYYSRERWMKLINSPENINGALTDLILNADSTSEPVKLGVRNEELKKLVVLNREIYLSKGQIPSGIVLSALNSQQVSASGQLKYGSMKDPFDAESVIQIYGNPMIIRFSDIDVRGLVLYVFDEAILAFAEGPERTAFIAAYNHNVLFISCAEEKVHKSKIINDNSQDIAAFYNKYSPVSDAEIIESHWEVENKDGRRSFRGGLKPEHNPLHFTFKYAKIIVRVGEYSASYVLSRYSDVSLLAKKYEEFKSASNNPKSVVKAESRIISSENNVFSQTSALVSDNINNSKPDVFADTNALENKESKETKEVATIDIGLCGTQHITKGMRVRDLLHDNYNILLNGDENNAICYDGIVDDKFYRINKIKIAFLLKETNGNTENGDTPDKYEDWDYMKWIREQQATGKEVLYPTLRNIAMWTSEFYDIFENGKTDKLEYLKDGTLVVTDELCRNLLKIAVVNLKKTWGKGGSDWNTLNEYISNEKISNVLKEEIKLISPDVVICGSDQVFDFAQNIYKTEIQKVKTSKQNELDYMKIDNSIFVKFYHPGCRKSREEVFDFAEDVFVALKSIM